MNSSSLKNVVIRVKEMVANIIKQGTIASAKDFSKFSFKQVIKDQTILW